MGVTFFLVGVDEFPKIRIGMYSMRKSVNHIGGEVLFSGLMLPDITHVTGRLIVAIDKKIADVVIIFSESEMEVTTAVLKELITERNISTGLAALMTDIKWHFGTKLTDPVCGIRNKTLIVNISGPCEKAIESVMEHGHVILEAARLISNESDENNADAKKSCEESRMEVEESENANNPINIPDSVIRFKSFQTREVNVEGAMQIIELQTQSVYKEIETVKLEMTYGRILSDNLRSKCNVPPCMSAAKRGYAVLVSDGAERRRIVSMPLTSMQSGTCVRVRSGEPLPTGATAVVQIENTREIKRDNSDDIERDKEIEIIIKPVEGENIRPIGCEIMKDTTILYKCTRIGAPQMALLASCGYNEVRVFVHPDVGILSIGDDLAEPGKILRPGYAYDSNRATLISLLRENDFGCRDFGIVPYDAISLIRKLKEVIETVDVLVTTGSANDRDILKPILQENFNVTIHFGRVNIKPGKSTTFGTSIIDGKLKCFLCLSGNPASVPITARLFLLPLVNNLRNYYDLPDVKILARIRSQYELHKRPKYMWTSLKWNEDDTYASAYDTADRNRNLFMYHDANALLMLPPRSLEVTKISSAFVPTLYTGTQ